MIAFVAEILRAPSPLPPRKPCVGPILGVTDRLLLAEAAQSSASVSRPIGPLDLFVQPLPAPGMREEKYRRNKRKQG